jgi:hypothetical protein
MNIPQIDWESGQVTYWHLGFLDPLRPLVEQIGDLKEDLAQITYGDRVLDVGWYPEFSEEGEFVVQVVRDTNWEEPLFQERCRTVDALVLSLNAAVEVAKGTSWNGSPGT